VTVVRPLREDDLDVWLRLRHASFGAPREPRDPEVRKVLTSRLPYSRGVEVDGRLAACCTWHPFRAWIGGVRVRVGALASVVTAPEARRRGLARTLILTGLEELRDEGVGWSLEQPFDPRFYARLGFRAFPAGVVLEMPLERLPGDARDVDYVPTTLADRELRRDHAAFASAHSFAFDRDQPFGPPDPEGEELPLRWRDLREAPAAGATETTAYRAEGGYALIATRGFGAEGRLHVVDVAWRDAAARRRVLAMLTAWRGQVGGVRIDLPVHDRLALAEAPRYAARREILQGRIIDLAAALTPLRAPDGGDAAPLTLRVHDDVLAWNDGVWHVAPGLEGTEVEPTTRTPEVEIRAGGLAAILAGVPPAAVRAAGDVEGPLGPLHRLAATTADHPTFHGTADFF
jgi:predicted acetyltransferase